MKIELEGQPDGGKEAIKQAIIKRLLPEWSRTSLTSYTYPLLLRDPFTVVVRRLPPPLLCVLGTYRHWNGLRLEQGTVLQLHSGRVAKPCRPIWRRANIFHACRPSLTCV